jgi:hypothetical protein
VANLLPLVRYGGLVVLFTWLIFSGDGATLGHGWLLGGVTEMTYRCVIVVACCIFCLIDGFDRALRTKPTRWQIVVEESTMAFGLLLLAIPFVRAFPMRDGSTEVLAICSGAAFGRLFRRVLEGVCLSKRLSNSILAVPSIMVVLLAVGAPHVGEPSMFHYMGEYRSSGMYSDPNLFGIIMAVGVGLSLGCFWLMLERQELIGDKYQILWSTYRLSWIIIGVFSLYFLRNVLASYSRTGWLCLAVIVLVLICYMSRRKTSGASSSRLNHIALAALGGCIIVGVALTMFAFLYPTTKASHIQRLRSMTDAVDMSWVNRIAAWDGQVKMIVDQPLFGRGWTAGRQIFARYYKPDFLREDGAYETNGYLKLTVACGLPVFVSLAVSVGLGRLWRTSCVQTISIRTSRGFMEVPIVPQEDRSESKGLGYVRGICVALTAGMLWANAFTPVLLAVPGAALFWTLYHLGSLTAAEEQA